MLLAEDKQPLGFGTANPELRDVAPNAVENGQVDERWFEAQLVLCQRAVEHRLDPYWYANPAALELVLMLMHAVLGVRVRQHRGGAEHLPDRNDTGALALACTPEEDSIVQPQIVSELIGSPNRKLPNATLGNIVEVVVEPPQLRVSLKYPRHHLSLSDPPRSPEP
jgi:hypothetical protein